MSLADRAGLSDMATILDMTLSLDGYVAGPRVSREQPLGEGGERLHEWLFALPSWRAQHGQAGAGELGPDDELYRARVEATGAYLMGRRMFSGGDGPWEDDPVADGWWGDEPPFGVPVLVLTHHAREPLEKRGTTFFFVHDGIEQALARAREAAGDRNVTIADGASVAQQLLRAGLLDELQLHVAPTLLGAGVRLFDGLDPGLRLEPVEVLASPRATHLRYRVHHP